MPKKLRSACDFCHQTKVKCSGGNPCSGCAQLYIECIYSASNRIGRPKGSRNKKTIERVKQYQAENEARQRAQRAENEASDDRDPQRTSSSPSLRHNHASSSSVSSAGSPMQQDPGEFLGFNQDSDPIIAPVEQVYSMFPPCEVPREFSEFDFPQSPEDQSWLAGQGAAANSMPFDFESANYLQARLDAESGKLGHGFQHPVLETAYPMPASTRSLSVSSTPSASTMMTPPLSAVSSMSLQSPGHSCHCLHDQASLLSQLALKSSEQSGSMELDSVLDTAQQAIKSWEAFLQCRPCSIELLRSNVDSYLVLTSSMKIILQILYDQFQVIESHAAAQAASNAATARAEAVHRSRSWSLGLYETNRLEGQLVSATLLVNIANGVVALSARLCEMTSSADVEASLQQHQHQQHQSPLMDMASAQAIEAAGHGPSAYASGVAGQCADMRADEATVGFGLRFLQHTARSIDRQARCFKENIGARIKVLM